MIWTTEPPTQEGGYWLRHGAAPDLMYRWDAPILVVVTRRGGQWMVAIPHDEIVIALNVIQGEWAGPLAPDRDEG